MDKPRIGILMVTGAFPPEISGGGKQCFSLVQALKEDFNVTVLTTSIEKDALPLEEHDEVLIRRIFIQPKSILSKIIVAAKTVAFFCRYQSKFEVMQLHGFSQKNMLMLFLAKLTGKRIVQLLSSAGLDDPLSLARKWHPVFTRYLLNTPDVIVSVSPALTKLYHEAKLPAGRLREILNGVDLEQYRPVRDKLEQQALRQKLGIAQDLYVIIFVGFFSRDKGADLLARAWDIARKKTKRPLEIVFVGARFSGYHEIDKTTVEKVNSIIADAQDHVVFVERTQQIQEWLRAADCFILPTLREGMPNSLLEAMATGLPCVISLLPGITDVVIKNGVNGYLVKPTDVNGFSDVLLQLCDNPQIAMEVGKAARKTIENRFDIRRIALDYGSLYRELVKR